jgi:hypothetical protein
MHQARFAFTIAAVAMLMALKPGPAHASEGYFYQGFTPRSIWLEANTIYANARLPDVTLQNELPKYAFS